MENVKDVMVTGRRTKKMVQKGSSKNQLMPFGSGMKNDKHGLSENSEAAACVEDRGKEKARVVVSEEDHDSDQ